jgi:hypothetical protein
MRNKEIELDEMLETLDVAKDEFAVLYGNSTTNKTRDYYKYHMKELNNIIILINELRHEIAQETNK